MPNGTVDLFRPKRPDGRPAWKVIFDWIVEQIETRQIEIGEIFTHEELTRALGCQQDSTYYVAVSKATDELQRQYGRSLRSERGKGYRLVAGMDQLRKGETHVDRSRREFSKALQTVQTIDDGILKDNERSLVDKVRVGMVAIAGVLQMQAEKVAEHDEQIAQLKSSRLDDRARARATEEEQQELRRRLDEVTARLDGVTTRLEGRTSTQG